MSRVGALFALSALLGACSSTTTPTADTSLAPGIPTGTPATVPSSSQSNIAAAFDDGTIDYPTSLLYRAYALFDSPKLPAEFRGPEGSLEDDFALPIEALKYADQLPESVASELQSLLVRPTIATSQLSAVRGPTVVTAALAAQAGTCQQVGANSWMYRDASVPIRVWIPCVNGAPAPGLDAAAVAGWADEFYGPMTDLMGPPIFDDGNADAGGSTAIDVYFVDFCIQRDGACRSGKAITIPATPFDGPKSSGYIVLSAGLLAADASATHNSVIHEFFHVLEYAHNYDALVAQGDDPHWFAEASAKWSETHFRRETSGAVHNFWFPRFQSTSISLHRPTSPDQAYAAYVWPFFMDLSSGAPTVASAWSNMEGATSFADLDSAIDSALSFSGSFRDFAVKNIDQDFPGEALGVRYDEFDNHFPVGVGPTSKLRAKTTIAVASTQLNVATVPELSAAYYELEPAQAVKQVKLDFSALDSADAADVDFVYERADGSGWMRRTLSSPPAKTKFCFNREEEHFKRAFMVVSNHDFSGATVAGAVAMEASDVECDLSALATVTVSHEKHGTYTSSRNNPVQLDSSDSATITFELEPDEVDPSTFVSASSTITWQLSLKSVETDENCTSTETASGGGSWTGDGGPTLLLHWAAPDHTLFGIVPDENRYTIEVMSPVNTLPDGDPQAWYKGQGDLCGVLVQGLTLPYTVLSIVDGPMPADGKSFSGSSTWTWPPANAIDVETVETVTWSISLKNP